MALAALLPFQAGDMQTSVEKFGKSCFFDLRCLEILEIKTFPASYDEIYELSTKVVGDPEYRIVIEATRELRKTGKAASSDIIFKNTSLLDTVIEPKILAVFQAQGNENVL